MYWAWKNNFVRRRTNSRISNWSRNSSGSRAWKGA
jgi:hypothetical protein